MFWEKLYSKRENYSWNRKLSHFDSFVPASSVDIVYPSCASDGGYHLMGQFYRFSSHKSASQAQTACENEGMHLVRAVNQQAYAALIMLGRELIKKLLSETGPEKKLCM